ncbi:MAG: VTT domain-containing protein [Bacilli bacterium]
MEVFVEDIIDIVQNLIENFGPFIGIIVIIFESMFPIVPLAIFIALNILVYGPVWGYILSWMATIIGCMLSFVVFRNFFHRYINKIFKNKKRYQKLRRWISNVRFSHLVLLVALPFTPAFAVNISAGLSDISKRKFFLAILVGKPFMVYFWGYVGYNFFEIFSRPRVLLDVVLLLTVAYIVSLIVERKLKIK